jgi:hypothetical protein
VKKFVKRERRRRPLPSETSMRRIAYIPLLCLALSGPRRVEDVAHRPVRATFSYYHLS